MPVTAQPPDLDASGQPATDGRPPDLDAAGKPVYRAENEKDASGSPFVRAATEFYEKSPIGAAVNLAKGTANAVGLTGNGFHPLDAAWDAVKGTAKAQWDQAVTAAQKAKEAANGGGMLSASEAVGHGLAAILPILGPAAADVGEHGARGDVAGMVGGALGLLAPFGAKYGLDVNAAKSAVPTTAKVQAGNAAANTAKANLLERQATETVAQRVLAPGNPRYKGTAETIAPEVLDRNVSKDIGRFGDARNELRQFAEDGMADAGSRIDAAVNLDPASPVSLTPVIDGLNKRIDTFQVKGKTVPGNEAKVAALEAQRDFVASHGDTLPFADLRKLRQILDTQAAEAKVYERAGNESVGHMGRAAADAAGEVRQMLATERPEAVQPNADFTFFKRLNDVLDPTLGRPKQTNFVPSGVTGGMSTTGALVGMGSKIPVIGPLIGSQVLPRLKALVNSPAWDLASAQKKMALADAIRNGQTGTATSLIANISALAPRGVSGWVETPATASSPDNTPR